MKAKTGIMEPYHHQEFDADITSDSAMWNRLIEMRKIRVGGKGCFVRKWNKEKQKEKDSVEKVW